MPAMGCAIFLGKIEQIVSVNMHPPGAPNHATLWSIVLKVHQSQLAPPVIWTLCASRSVIEDIAYVLDVYYKLLVNSRGGIINRKASATDLGPLHSVPSYVGHHTVFAVGWNYNPASDTPDVPGSDSHRTSLHPVDLPFTLPDVPSLAALEQVDVPMAHAAAAGNTTTLQPPSKAPRADDCETHPTSCDSLPPPVNFCDVDIGSGGPASAHHQHDTDVPHSVEPSSLRPTTQTTDGVVIPPPIDYTTPEGESQTARLVHYSPPPGFGDLPAPAVPPLQRTSVGERATGHGGVSTVDSEGTHGPVAPPTTQRPNERGADTSDIASIYTSLKSFRLEPIARKHISRSSDNSNKEGADNAHVNMTMVDISDATGDELTTGDELDASFEYLIGEIEIIRSLRQGLEGSGLVGDIPGSVSVETQDQLVEVWVSIKALVASVWDMTEIVFAESKGDCTSFSTPYLRQGASDACAVLGSVLEVATQLPSLCPGNATSVKTLLAGFDAAAMQFLKYLKFVVDIETVQVEPISMVVFHERVQSLLVALSKVMRDLSCVCRPIRMS